MDWKEREKLHEEIEKLLDEHGLEIAIAIASDPIKYLPLISPYEGIFSQEIEGVVPMEGPTGKCFQLKFNNIG